MKESIWGYAILTLGILAIGIIWFFANVTRTDQHNYNLLKETVEAAMYDAIDLSVYRDSGTIKISEEIFIGNFLRRFAENADLSNEYVIEIYDVTEVPPKVSLKVSSKSSTTSTGGMITFDVANRIDAILESKYQSEKSKSVNDLCILVKDEGGDESKPELGDYYLCRVNKTRWEFFFVLNTNDQDVNLIMDRNLSEGVYMPNRDNLFENLTNGWIVDVRLPNLMDYEYYVGRVITDKLHGNPMAEKFVRNEEWIWTNLSSDTNINYLNSTVNVGSNFITIVSKDGSAEFSKQVSFTELKEKHNILEREIQNMEYPSEVNIENTYAYWILEPTSVLDDSTGETSIRDGWCVYPFEPYDCENLWENTNSLEVCRESVSNKTPNLFANGQVWLERPDCSIRPVITLLNE